MCFQKQYFAPFPVFTVSSLKLDNVRSFWAGQTVIEVILCVLWQEHLAIKSQNRLEKDTLKTFTKSQLIRIQESGCYDAIWNKKDNQDENKPCFQ